VLRNRRRTARSSQLSPMTKFLWFVAAGLLVGIALHALLGGV
jgi:hypothetical protein